MSVHPVERRSLPYLAEWLSQAHVEDSPDATECRDGVEPQTPPQLERSSTQIGAG